VGGVRTVAGIDGLAVGETYSLSIDLISAGRSARNSERIENTVIAGNLVVIGLSGQSATLPEGTLPEEKDAEILLFEQVMEYSMQWDQAEEELASLLHLRLVKPLPTLVTIGNAVDVSYLLDTPHGFDWQGVYLDADLRIVETMGEISDIQHAFMKFSSLHGSFLESKVLADGFGVEAVSTAKLLQSAKTRGESILNVGAGTIDTILPSLALPENIKDDIANAVNQGFSVTIPEFEQMYEDWLGIGYIKENHKTGEAGWMLSGGLAGGMTAWSVDRWDEYLADILQNPFTGVVNSDPAAAVKIEKLIPADMQQGIVGKTLSEALQVIVLDEDRHPVLNTPVTFTVKAGGGAFANGQSIITVNSDYNGIAEAALTLGRKTSANPFLWWESGYTYSEQVGENIIEAKLASGSTLHAPITAYGFPDVPASLVKTEGDIELGQALSWNGPLVALVEDQYGNPIANQEVTFTVLPVVDLSDCVIPNQDLRPAQLVEPDDGCFDTMVYYGQCATATDTLTMISSRKGAHVQIILGGVPDGEYKVTAGAAGLTETFLHYAYPFGNCYGDEGPASSLHVSTQYASDEYGNSIAAGKVGTIMPLIGRAYVLREKAVDTGSKIVGTREYYIDTSSVDSITFNGQPGVSQGDGLYTYDYPLPPEPQVVDILVEGSATIDGATLSDGVSTQRSAVDIDTEEELFVPVDENGLLPSDYMINYRIKPPQYKAGSAYVVMYKDKTPVMYIPGETTDAGFITLTRGYQFELSPGVEYQTEILLNPGTGVEIASKKVILHPIALELDADMNGDGKFLEDDPYEDSGIGVAVPKNRDDDDNDGIVDLLDDLMRDADNNPVPDNDLVKIKLTGLPADLIQGTVTLKIISGQDKIRVWDSPEKNTVMLEPWLDLQNMTLPNPQISWLLGGPADISMLPEFFYVEGIKENSASDDSIILTANYTSANGTEIETDRLKFTVFTLAMAPDYNRDGAINDDDRGKVTEEEPWRFWVNDDDDKDSDPVTGITTDGDGLISKPDDLPGQDKDNGDNQVNGLRDLVDFFPLYLDLSGALQIWPPDNGYTYRLRNQDSSVAVFIPRFNGNYISADQAGTYLKDLDISGAQRTSAVSIIGPEGFDLPEDFLQAIKNMGARGVVLVEGRQISQEPLVLEVIQDGALMSSFTLPLQVMDVEEMYAQLDLRSEAGGGSLGESDRYIDRATNSLLEIPGQPYIMQTADRTLVWMHGYKVNPTEARATFAEVFKRFFHAGLEGRFLGVSWYGDPRGHLANPTASEAPHYHQAVVNAFATAGAFADFIINLEPPVAIAAHSLGNLLVGEAIENHQLVFDKYFAVDASVALEAYGQAADVAAMVNPDGSFSDDPNAGMVNVTGWPEYIVAGQSRLLASEWYKQFDASDNRSKLTWRKRLRNVPSGKVFNFYSSTEDVLKSYDDDNLVLDDNGWSKEALAVSTWVKQEKFKGRRSDVFFDIGGATSSYCGWSFNSDWDVEKDPPEYDQFGNSVKTRRTPAQAAEIVGTELKSKPFFNLPVFKLFGPDLSELVSDDPNDQAPSDFVMKKISETDLTNYYTANEAAHDKVKVRDWLLAEAFPATTLPMGANKNNVFQDIENQNIDMSASRENKGCKTDEKRWPREDPEIGRPWLHSDYKAVPYQHVYEFYEKINELSGN
jgi:hypothetical protein